MHSVAKMFRGLQVDSEAYFRCTICGKIVGSVGPDEGKIVGSVGPDESYGNLPDDIDNLLTNVYTHQESACTPE